MSIIAGATYSGISAEGEGQRGYFTREALYETIGKVQAQLPAAEGLLRNLASAAAFRGHPKNFHPSMKRRGENVVAVSNDTRFGDTTIEGAIFTRGIEKNEAGIFTLVEVEFWADQEQSDYSYRSTLTNVLSYIAPRVREVNGRRWKQQFDTPVARDTVMHPLAAPEGVPLTPYVLMHPAEVAAIKGLSIDDSVKANQLAALEDLHSAERHALLGTR